MSSVYVEVGHKCYSICKSCDINDQPRPEIKMDAVNFEKTLRILRQLGMNKQIRLTGYDPVSANFIADVMLRNLDFEFKILTTLLRINPAVYIAKHLMVSLSATHEFYHEFFKVKKWELFVDNFDTVSLQRKDIELNVTLTDVLMRVKPMMKFVDFVNSRSSSIQRVQFFNSMNHAYQHELSREDFKYFASKLLMPWDVEWSSDGAPQRSCYVSRETIYVKLNGDVYPCCMAGGELGQNLVPSLKLCNIFDFESDIPALKAILDAGLPHIPKNKICDHCTPKYIKINTDRRRHDE